MSMRPNQASSSFSRPDQWTGGGKSAILELARLYLCRHVVFVPEAAIFRIQRKIKEMARANPDAGLIICDPGTLDGLPAGPGVSRVSSGRPARRSKPNSSAAPQSFI
jgi:hypothetical protein